MQQPRQQHRRPKPIRRPTSALLGLLLAAACRESGAVAVSATARAKAQAGVYAWFRAHGGGRAHPDQLAELKDENPSAYAIVKALLTKRTLGLLDPKHPSASFAARPPPSEEDVNVDMPAAQGAAAFAKMAEDSNEGAEKPKDQASLAFPDAPAAPAHHDWFNWKPSQRAADDDAIVKSVLGEADDSAGTNYLRGQGGSPNSDAGNNAGSGVAHPWKDFMAGLSAEKAAPTSAAAGASAADGEVSREGDSNDGGSSGGGSRGAKVLLSWLDSDEKKPVAPVAVPKAVATPAPKQNSYLMELQ